MTVSATSSLMPSYTNPGRMIADGIPYSDFVNVSQKIEAGGSWFDEWMAVATKYEALGREALASGKSESAGRWLWLASLSAHYAQYMWFHEPDVRQAGQKRKQELYLEAAPHLNPRAQRFDLDFEEWTIPGYIRLPQGAEGPHPWVVLLGGLESTKEESLLFEDLCLERGIATVAFDGPGQGELFAQTALRPDFHRFTNAVVEYAQSRDELDDHRIAIFGRSFGGYYAMRSAASQPLFRACVSWGGAFDLSNYPNMSPTHQAGFMYVAGYEADDEAGYEQLQKDINLRDFAADITCPLLMLHGAHDSVFSEAALESVKATFRNADLTLRVEPNGDHCCHNMADEVRPMLADWLAERLR